MCGIFCEITCCISISTENTEVINRLNNRGPNHAQCLEITAQDKRLLFHGAVLWMQGSQLTPQPVENKQGVLLYNGDIFDEHWDTNKSDTGIIMDKLCLESNISSKANILKELKSLKGPFAIIYFDKQNDELYFMRDCIGRTSLLFHKNENSIIISNVLGRKYDCVEIPATDIQILNLKTYEITCIPWDDTEEILNCQSLEEWLKLLKVQQNLPDDQFQFTYVEENVNDKDNLLIFMEKQAQETVCKLTLMEKLMNNDSIKKTTIEILRLLEKSLELRLRRQPNKCKICLNGEESCSHCTVGVLFSGGLDCTILALLADKYLPREQSIDLINVAFSKDANSSYDVPDRLTGRQSLNELQDLCPARKWEFKEVNISKEELENYQESVIADLVFPRETILDESLGSALWFAARGQDDFNTSTCRVLLVGSGADELFGGYVRHRNAYKRLGWAGLSKELQLDWKRISFRNLARDNRVICDHGRQPRMPYLDEDLTSYILQLKPWLRCFPSEQMGLGIGDKLILRLVAFQLGLTDAVILPKRALQFGSRIANKKEKGSDISLRFRMNK